MSVERNVPPGLILISVLSAVIPIVYHISTVSDPQNFGISQNVYKRSDIQCLAELLLLGSIQRTSEDILAKSKASRVTRLLPNSRHHYGPAVQDILSEKIDFHERLLPGLVAQKRVRMDYLKGATDVEPVHDILFTGLTENPIPAGEADWDRARERVSDIQLKVDSLKPTVHDYEVPEELEVSALDADPQGSSAKRRRLNTSLKISIPSGSSSSSRLQTARSRPTVSSLEDKIQDMEADVSYLIAVELDEMEEGLRSAFDEHVQKLRNLRPPVPLFHEENAEERLSNTMEQFQLQRREEVALVENEVARRRLRNSELEGLNRDLESRIIKHEQWVREAAALLEQLKSTPSPNSTSESSLLSHPHIAHLVAPFQHNLVISARILMYGLLEGVWKDLQEVIGSRANDLLKDFERELKPTFQQTEEIFQALL